MFDLILSGMEIELGVATAIKTAALKAAHIAAPF